MGVLNHFGNVIVEAYHEIVVFAPDRCLEPAKLRAIQKLALNKLLFEHLVVLFFELVY